MNETNNAVITQIQLSGVEQETALSLQNSFAPFYERAKEWETKAMALVITDASQKKEMAEARTARLALKDIRVEVEKKRKFLKEESLRKGKAIDGVANVLKSLIEPIELHLEQQEKFVELKDLQMREDRKLQRIEQLSKYVSDTSFYDLLNMPEDGFASLLAQQKAGAEAILAQAQKAEEDRIAKEKADAAEREAQRLENEKLKAEAAIKEKELAAERAKAEVERKAVEDAARKEREAIEAKAKADRDAAEKTLREERARADAEAAKLKAAQDAKLKEEREAREKVEDELKAKQAAEAKVKQEAEAAEKARVAAEKKAAKAPDKEKLTAWVRELSLGDIELKSAEAKAVENEIRAKHIGFKLWCETQISSL